MKNIFLVIFLLFFFPQIVRADDEPLLLNAKQIFALNSLMEHLNLLKKYEDDMEVFTDIYLTKKCTKKKSILDKASKGDQRAQYWLVSMYIDALCIKQNKAKGLDLLIQLGYDGHVDAQRDLGTIYKFGTWNEIKNFVTINESKAFEWYEKAAKNGDGLSAFYYGNYFEEGKIVMQDFHKAEKYYNIGIRGQDVKGKKLSYLSLVKLYLMYFNYEYQRENYNKSNQYYDNALDLSIECSNIGFSECMLFASTLSASSDLIEAYKWANLATAFNEDPRTKEIVQRGALESRGQVAEKMTLDEILLAQRLSKQWLPKLNY